MISFLNQVLQFLIMVVIIFGQDGFSLDTDTINSSLVLKDSDTIHSSGKVFALGFFSPNGTTSRYVGIWYFVSPETVAWVANRDRPLNDSSGTVSISSDGDIVVMNGLQEIVWSSNIASSNLSSSTSNTSARLLDSGNLVLRDRFTGKRVWESFAHPTDTFLPLMRQSHNPRTGAKVVYNSWRTLQSPGHGNFTMGLNAVGVPQSYIWDLRNGTVPYWRSGPWNDLAFTGVTLPYSASSEGYTLTTERDGTVDITWSEVQYLNRITLSSNGSLSNTIWNDEKKDWIITWIAPANDCDLYNFCGPFALCYIKNSPICSCLKGFEPSNIEEWSSGIWKGGCTLRSSFRCQKDGTNGCGFSELTSVKVPDFVQRKSGLETDCEGICSRNCSCLAYAYDSGIGCMFWSESLIDIQKFPPGANAGTNLYIRLHCPEIVKKNHKALMLSGIGSVIAAFVCLLGVWCICKQRGNCLSSTNETWSKGLFDKNGIEELPIYSFQMLANATNNFDMANKLGRGGFGPVFKGKLGDSREIAVKRLSEVSGQGFEEFMNEVILISKLQHRNLVRLLGCCVEKEEKMLVYEYVHNRSLDVYLFNKTQNVLCWRKRFNIIEGIGRGLLYLHRDSRLRIIHRDLKPSNVLLDEEWNPKISDFGMARIFGGTQDQATTGKVVGTHGYMAPEYVAIGSFSEKSDVFSFGVLMLEIISGRKNTSFYNDEFSLSLLAHAWKLWNEDKAMNLIDERVSDSNLRAEIMRCMHIGLLCVQEFHGKRPSISTVLSMLSSQIVDLPTPAHPGFTESWHIGSEKSSKSSNEISITMLEGR